VWKHGDFFNEKNKLGVLKEGISHIFIYFEFFLPNGKISPPKKMFMLSGELNSRLFSRSQ
jgi:hypothetical protein